MKNVYLPTIEEVKGDREWSRLEIDLLAKCRLGSPARLSASLPKDRRNPDLRVRGELVRYLMLGGCNTKHSDSCLPHPKGVNIRGAWIDGIIDLNGCVSKLNLTLMSCLFTQRLDLQDACIGALFLDGSRFEKAVDLHRIKVTHGVHLRDGLIALQGIDLVGAKVGGSVDLDHSTIISKAGNAINATSAKVGRTMFFRNVKVVGNVSFLRVSVGGNLNFTGSEFSGDINLQSSRIADNLVWKEPLVAFENLI